MNLRTRLILAIAGSGLALLVGGFVVRDVGIRYAAEASIRTSIEDRLSTLDRATCEAGLDPRPFPPRGQRRPGGPFGPLFGPGFGAGPGPAGFGDPQGPEGPPGAERPDGPPREGRPGEEDLLAPHLRGPGGRPRMIRVIFYGPAFEPRFPEAPPFPETARAQLIAGENFVQGRQAGGFYGVFRTAWPEGPCAYAVAVMPTPPPLASMTSLMVGAVLLIGFPALALWLALAQPIRRIRALAAEVRAAAAKHYETSVTVTGRDEIAELGQAFNEASAEVRAHLAEVERREKALRDFVAHTTHDVALPVSVLLSHASTLRDGAASPPDPATVAAIAQESQYIASLLANLEAVSRLEADATRHERHPVDLTALVERVAARHRGIARTTGVEFNHSAPMTPVWVTGDITLIEQAANNLVHNAIQYNHAGGHVAFVLEGDADAFTLRVSDDGPGVSEPDLAKLGQSRFRSDEARSRRPNGMGLGLSITRDVARRHGFDLSLGRGAEGGFEAVISGKTSKP